MTDVDDLLRLVPDMDLDLTDCGALQANGLPTPVVVSLARRPDRWRIAKENLARAGIDRPIKAPAVDGQTLEAELLARLLADPGSVDRLLEEYLQPTRPAVGCYFSHIAIWRAFLASGEPYVLVLEDDALPASEFSPERNRALVAAMPGDADMLLLGCTIMDGLAEATTDPKFTRIYYYNGTYAYLLTRKGALSLLPRLLPMWTHIDNQISLELVTDPDHRVYCCEPRLFDHDFEVTSDVYVPVAESGRADRTLAAIFERCREQLSRSGVKLFPKFEPR